MPIIKISTVLLIFISSIHGLLAQTKLDKAKKEWNGFFISVGARQSNFLNETFKDNVSNDVIKRGIGFEIGMNYRLHPFRLGVTYFDSGYEVEEIGMSGDKMKKPIHFRGIELGLDMAILPDVKWLAPTVGVGYNFGQLTIKEEDSTLGLPSTLSLAAPYLNLSLAFRTGFLSLEPFYKRHFDFSNEPSRGNYHYGITLLLQYSKFEL